MIKKRERHIKKSTVYAVDVFCIVGKDINRIIPMGYDIFTSDDISDITDADSIIKIIGQHRNFNNGKYEIKYLYHFKNPVIAYATSSGSSVLIFFNNLHTINETT